MGRRSRRRESGGDRMERGYARAEERNRAIREQLEPLAPGERPGAVTVAAIIAALLGTANLVLLAAGVDVDGKRPSAAGTVVFTALMFAAAYGMWRAKYWAVLGFQALLAITIIVAFLSLAVASNALAVVLCLAVSGLGGWLFWKLVRALARLQMPERRPRPPVV